MIFQQLFDLFKTPGLYQTGLEAAILILLPALGGTISERSGVVNIAMEGLMLIGAFVAVDVALAWHNAWIATLVAMIAGGLTGAPACGGLDSLQGGPDHQRFRHQHLCRRADGVPRGDRFTGR